MAARDILNRLLAIAAERVDQDLLNAVDRLHEHRRRGDRPTELVLRLIHDVFA
jgi:hypothetical protein